MRWLLLIPLGLLPFVGCTIGDALENAPCNNDDDCVGNYGCVRTAHQEQNGLAGLCREGIGCAVGVQEGCEASGNECSPSRLQAVCTGSLCFCCTSGSEISEPLATPGGPSEVLCLNCSSTDCPPEASESCAVGEPRCVVPDGSTCGCRAPEDEIENSPCVDETTCGEGFVCTRTLEQQAEPASAEENPEEQAQEPGWCRPEDMPECVAGQQEGCRNDGSCASGMSEQCVGNRCYCCDDPVNSADFSVHVYELADAEGTSAACVECNTTVCTGSPEACTLAEDSTCVVPEGSVCGCPPSE